MTTHLSERAKQLIPKAKIFNFDSWESRYPESSIERGRIADAEGRYLNDKDLVALGETGGDPQSLETVRFLRDNATEIVAEARGKVLDEFPGISEAGGDLYPTERAEACWRDFWHFLRSITYGIAGSTVNYTNADGLENMNLLYRELKVPLPAMVCGLEALKASSLKRMVDRSETLAPYFDWLVEQLRQFK
ncbi:MAG: phycobilisome protein [Cyanobacteria bacterium SID2]|nr:phycobilisome protein [Cyanobacteria bacterium SID2]MBP0005857.1 phycobilisome protein [Cyanobacteria bacterium SBC]